MEFLTPSGHHTVCEFKGIASYYHLTVDGRTSNNAAWYYSEPRPGYENLTGYVAFYPQSVDEATVDGERVGAQPGHFYGGWVTSEVVGPFKGEPGSNGW
jgi:uncharacterized protein (DUF427 family)